jgi:hypothetical protein
MGSPYQWCLLPLHPLLNQGNLPIQCSLETKSPIWFFLTLIPCTPLVLCSKSLRFFSSPLSPVTRDLSAHFPVYSDFLRSLWLISQRPTRMAIETHAFCFSLLLMVFSASLLALLCCRHTQLGPFSRVSPTSLPWLSLEPMGQEASFCFCSTVSGCSDAKDCPCQELSPSLRCLATFQTQVQGSYGPPSDLLCWWIISLLVSHIYQFNHIDLFYQSNAQGFFFNLTYLYFFLPPENLERI